MPEEIKYGYVSHKINTPPRVLYATFADAVESAKRDQPLDMPYYIVECTFHYEICGVVENENVS